MRSVRRRSSVDSDYTAAGRGGGRKGDEETMTRGRTR